MNREYPNPYGVLIKTGKRNINIGKILNANVPVPWLQLLDDQTSPIKLLLNSVWESELEMFTSALTEQDYLQMVEATCERAIEVDQERKAQRMGYGVVHPSHPTFPLCQLLAHLMQDCKKIDQPDFSESLLYVACGIMDLPPPIVSLHLVQEGHIIDQRTNTCFRLLKWIFPDPFEDGKRPLSQELLMFGYQTEEELWARSTNTQEYDESIAHISNELIKFRILENIHFNEFFHPLPMMPFDNVPYNYLPLNGRVGQDENRGEEGEEDGGEEEEEEVEVEEEEEIEDQQIFQNFQ
ncbi:hypothetical protein CAEBREN_09090 [Caenorhabditis brenneri]|uniref:Uncharacterized protein n=1 Tax=Caenorhabditis brenneri TaxID=135651 RepID=G0N0N3_CAEBE|nr:hypothetical protein CAEBREN_09090 [Caenorhabditis brenneri]